MSTSDTNTTITQPDIAEIKVHEYHKHGDVVLRANDGTYFYVDSWRLKQASTFFKDLLEIPQSTHNINPNRNLQPERVPAVKEDDEEGNGFPKNDGEATTIKDDIKTTGGKRKRERDDTDEKEHASMPAALMQIDTSPHILELILNLVNVSIPFPLTTTFTETIELFLTCEMLLCKESIIKHVRDRLYDQGKTSQWDLLLFASDRNDLTMGRHALQMMDNLTFTRAAKTSQGVSELDQPLNTKRWYKLSSSQPFWTRFRTLRVEWQADILFHAIGDPVNLNGHSYGPVTPYLPFRSIGWQKHCLHFPPKPVTV